MIFQNYSLELILHFNDTQFDSASAFLNATSMRHYKITCHDEMIISFITHIIIILNLFVTYSKVCY
jgi:hypothetical protein